MNIQQQYLTIVQPSPFNIPQYRASRQYLDPTKIMQDRKFRHKRSHGKFTPSKRNKKFFLDQVIQPLKNNPSPDKYKTTLNLLQQFKKGKINSGLKPNAKKNTYIDQIQAKQTKQKQPGIGKYNLLTLTDFNVQNVKKLKIRDNPEKQSYFDTVKVWPSKCPGPGQHNPHDEIKKVKLDRTDYKFYQQKHKKEEQKIRRSLSAKLGPTTYNPVSYNTFDAIKIKSKNKQPSKWTHGEIEIRKGIKSRQKHPSPADYKLINQWVPITSSSWRKKQEAQIGKLHLFDKTVKSARSLSVYRD